MVIAAMLGIPESDRDYVRRTTDEQLHREPGERDMERHHRVGAELVAYYGAQFAERRKKPRDDMMSALLAAEITEDDGSSRKLTDEEAVAFIKLLSSAGNETTAKLIGWIGSSLAEFPGERAKLVKQQGPDPQRRRGDPALRAPRTVPGPRRAARCPPARGGRSRRRGRHLHPGGNGT